MNSYVICGVLLAVTMASAVYYPSCQEAGNLYEPATVNGVECAGFRQKDMTQDGSLWWTQSCPPTLKFDTRSCVCVRAKDAVCLTMTSAPNCTENGNLYEPIFFNKVACGGFQQRDTLTSVITYTHECPPNTLFDTNPCVCAHEDSFTCPL